MLYRRFFISNAEEYTQWWRMVKLCTDLTWNATNSFLRLACGFPFLVPSDHLTRDAVRTGTASGMHCTPYCPQRRILHAVAVELYANGRHCTHGVRTVAHG